MKLSEKQQKLLKDLEAVRSNMEYLLDEESVLSLPKKFSRVKDDFDAVLQALEDGEYEETTDDQNNAG
jgi:hypothetical protein